jgi:Thin aggregative fimbriae synthesis protein
MFNFFKQRYYQLKNGDLLRSPFSFYLLLLLYVLSIKVSYSAGINNPASVRAWFKFIPDSTSLLVLPMSYSKTKTLVEYKISAIKIGPSGRSQSSQSGQQVLLPQQDMSLSTLRFSLSENDHYQFDMKIYIKDKLISATTAKYP